MATVRIIENILDAKEKVFSVSEETSIEQIIRGNTAGDVYEGELVECYDCETGKTTYVPIEDDRAVTNAIVEVNGKTAGLDYRVKKDDVVYIVITPSGEWNWAGAWAGLASGAGLGATFGGIIGSAIPGVGNLVGALIGVAAGGVIGFVAGGFIGGAIAAKNNSSLEDNLKKNSLPDIRGASNQPLLDNPFPVVFGKHLTVPFIIGSPYNEISGRFGDTNYIHVLYAVGYAPLRLTDFKLGEMFLAHNQPWTENPNLPNVFHGTLHGTNGNLGDIVNTWSNNDISIEILQQRQDETNVSYGSIYPEARIQENVNASVLYCVDEALGDIISYKGCALQNGLRNNPIRFSQECPLSIQVELNIPNGLYKSRTETDDDNNSKNVWSQIPLWVAIQWRVYSEGNDAADGEKAGELEIPAFNYQTGSYTSTKRGWNSFSLINNEIEVKEYTLEDRYKDLEAHTGNSFKNPEPIILNYDEDNNPVWIMPPVVGGISETCDINNGWIDAKVFNLEELGATDSNSKGLNEIRCVTSVNLESWARRNLRAEGDTEADFRKKFKSYFLDGSNTTKSVEVRVVRVSPNYLDETVSTKEHSAYRFNDVFSWKTISSTMFDKDRFEESGVLSAKRPLEAEKMRKLCVVALTAKTDNVDQISNTLEKFSCVAESFAPYYDSSIRKWIPIDVHSSTNYYDPSGNRISKDQYINDRQNGIKSKARPAGNDFTRQIVNNYLRIPSHLDSKGRYIIPNDSTMNFVTNNVASIFLLAGIGGHLGVDALSYAQPWALEINELGDFNMVALAKWHEWAKDVTDGSTYASDGYHYTHDGARVSHRSGEDVHVYFAANAYVYQTSTLSSLFTDIAQAGRAVYTKDKKGRFTVIVDKHEDYPVGLINQQNTLQSSYTISYSELPSGLQITYPAEDDGYNELQLYCMADGEDASNPTGSIEPVKFKFVTNNYQAWSLGRYYLANRILNREVVIKKVGMEGYSMPLGSLVVLQDDTMLIGTDTGGRITKLIETDNYIYGFIINNTYSYTAETEAYTDSRGNSLTRSKQGCIIMQPNRTGEARVVTLRLAKPGTEYTVGGITYRPEKGKTNLVLLDHVISKSDPSDKFVYTPSVDNIVGFGLVGTMSATYRVIKTKQDAKHNFELTLCKYQENLYNYGAKLPSFQNNMTLPDRSKEDAFTLSNNVTYADMMKALAEAADLAQGRIDRTLGHKPPVPDNLKAEVEENIIRLSCTVDSEYVNLIDHIEYQILKLDESVIDVNGSYSTNYYFNRLTDGYPEASELVTWQIRVRAVSFYKDSEGNKIVGDWSEYVGFTETSLRNYGTWIPSKPVVTFCLAEEAGINVSWRGNNTRMYGSAAYYVTVLYNGLERTTLSTVTEGATYLFDRDIDGFPEKPGTIGKAPSTLTLDNYTVKVKAVNTVSGMFTIGDLTAVNYTKYKTWIPAKPSISPRITNRNITLYLSQDTDCYGNIQYLVGVRRYDDPEGVFYYPDLITNPYSRESAYKKYEDGLFVVGKIESESQYTQTMPLEVQNGTQAALDFDDRDDVTKLFAVPVESPEDNRILLVTRKGTAPMDTAYQFEVYSFNKTTQGYVDNISVEGSQRQVVALATSVQDVLNSSIVSDKIGNSAVENSKIASNAVTADKIFTYNFVSLTSGSHAISGFAPGETTDPDFYNYLERVKSNSDDVANKDGIDDYIKRHALSYWIGLDTDHPEFWMGNVRRADKNIEGANYFHYYYDSATASTNLDLQLTNFILKAISSTIKGFFNVRDRAGRYVGDNSFLCINPEVNVIEGITTPTETMILRGDFFIRGSNSGTSEGTLNVNGLSTFTSAVVNDTLWLKNSTQIPAESEDLSEDAPPALVIGTGWNQAHLMIDANQIEAMSDGENPASLFLNAFGGNVEVGAGIFRTNGNIESRANILLVNSSSKIIATPAGSSWVKGRDNAKIRLSTRSSSQGYDPVMSLKTQNGTWDIGTYLDNILHFTYITDTDYNSNRNNQTVNIKFSTDSGGTLTVPRVEGTADYAKNLYSSSAITATCRYTSGNRTYTNTATLVATDGTASFPSDVSIGGRASVQALCLTSKPSSPQNGDIWIE